MAVRDGPDLGGTVNRELWKPHTFKATNPGGGGGGTMFEAASFANAAIVSGAYQIDQWEQLLDYQLQRIQSRTYPSSS